MQIFRFTFSELAESNKCVQNINLQQIENISLYFCFSCRQTIFASILTKVKYLLNNLAKFSV